MFRSVVWLTFHVMAELKNGVSAIWMLTQHHHLAQVPNCDEHTQYITSRKS